MSRQQPPARAAMVDQPFRLLDLSTELRLMVYESIETINVRHVLKDPLYGYQGSGEPAVITLVTPSLPMALLALCHQVHDEASAVFLKALSIKPVRFILVWKYLPDFAYRHGILHNIAKSGDPTAIDKVSGNDYLTILSTRPIRLRDVDYPAGTPAHTAMLTLLKRCRGALIHAKSIIIALDIRNHTYNSVFFSYFAQVVSERFGRILGSATHVGFVLRANNEWQGDSEAYASLHEELQMNANQWARGFVVHERQDLLTDEVWERDWDAHHV